MPNQGFALQFPRQILKYAAKLGGDQPLLTGDATTFWNDVK